LDRADEPRTGTLPASEYGRFVAGMSGCGAVVFRLRFGLCHGAARTVVIPDSHEISGAAASSTSAACCPKTE
jgi:hypothetical protein